MNRDIIVIGASAGGVEALPAVIGALPADLPAAVFVVLHIPPYSRSLLPRILSSVSKMPVSHPADTEPIHRGHVYVAPPNRHLRIMGDRIQLDPGARENGHRPSIDVLFRSAAEYYGPRTIGVVLTGMLDDGTAGLAEIKQRGGLALVQDPADATYPSMPESALRFVDVDHTAPLVDLGPAIVRLSADIVGEEVIKLPSETEIAGAVSAWTCPLCHGTLWEHQAGALTRFACRVGHSFTETSLATDLQQEAEDALWIALRVLEENRDLNRRIARRAGQSGRGDLGTRFEGKASEAERQMVIIRRLIHDRVANATTDESVQ